jgi:hypothetical protein
VGQLDKEGHAISFRGGKWKVSSGAMIFALGYKTSTLYMTTVNDAFGYRFWNDQNRKIIRSRNVTFNEKTAKGCRWVYRKKESSEKAMWPRGLVEKHGVMSKLGPMLKFKRHLDLSGTCRL